MASPDPALYANYIAAEQEARASDATTANAILERAEFYERLHQARMALFADGAWQDGEVVEVEGQPPRIRVGDNLLIAAPTH